ncbi:MAG: hypothetical protein E7624_00550 [Ruminococcaceae bacterium]|nr:hypothetical protein [Oscillospiraceae bacterium]
MSVAGLILSNLHDTELSPLTGKRTTGAVPFGGRYRLIDFPLSAMVGTGITRIYVVAHHNYQSLMEHIGSGKDWDLARHNGGIHILPPYNAAYANPAESYESRMRTLVSVRGMVERMEEEHVLCCDCDAVGMPDFSAFVQAHKKSGLPMTVGSAEGEGLGDYGSLHVWIARTDFLRELLRRAEEERTASFYGEAVRREAARGNVGSYRFSERFFRLHSVSDYYRLHMLLASDVEVRRTLMENSRTPLLTKAQNLPPVKYGKGAEVQRSLIADGCVIEGKVVNSVLFRGVHVGANCVVENAVLLERSMLSGNARISGTILDKNVILGGNVSLAGHPSLPFFVEEGRVIN